MTTNCKYSRRDVDVDHDSDGDDGDDYGDDDETSPLLRTMDVKNESLDAIHDDDDDRHRQNNNNNKHHLPTPHNHRNVTPLRQDDGGQQSYSYFQRRRRGRTVITAAYRRQRYETRKQAFACALAACSGFADVLCYHSFGCYGNMMTGNTIKLMDHLAAGRWGEALYPAALVPAYIFGAALCTWLSKLDLTRLGLGGPSARAFSHLQPPRRLRSSQQISILRVVAVGCVALFLLGELFGTGLWYCWWSSSRNDDSHDSYTIFNTAQRWRLPFFACAFGLLNAATLAATHLVTNAVTGHWITVGLGVADDLPILLNRHSSYHRRDGDDRVLGHDDDDNNNDKQNCTENDTSRGIAEQRSIGPPEEESIPLTEQRKQWKSSMFVAASFLVSIILTSVFYNECTRQLEHHPRRPLALLFRFSPPMGVLFSVIYTVLLYWYTLPPPFLRGFTSQIDLMDLLMDHDDETKETDER